MWFRAQIAAFMFSICRKPTTLPAKFLFLSSINSNGSHQRECLLCNLHHMAGKIWNVRNFSNIGNVHRNIIYDSSNRTSLAEAVNSWVNFAAFFWYLTNKTWEWISNTLATKLRYADCNHSLVPKSKGEHQSLTCFLKTKKKKKKTSQRLLLWLV